MCVHVLGGMEVSLEYKGSEKFSVSQTLDKWGICSFLEEKPVVDVKPIFGRKSLVAVERSSH